MENKYLEIIEVDDKTENIKTVKIKVVDKKEAQNILSIEEKEFIGRKYIARYHICGHNQNGKNKLCKCEILKEIIIT